MIKTWLWKLLTDKLVYILAWWFQIKWLKHDSESYWQTEDRRCMITKPHPGLRLNKPSRDHETCYSIIVYYSNKIEFIRNIKSSGIWEIYFCNFNDGKSDQFNSLWSFNLHSNKLWIGSIYDQKDKRPLEESKKICMKSNSHYSDNISSYTFQRR